MGRLAVLFCLGIFFAAEEAVAGCCGLIKVDPESTSAHVRACDPDSSGVCDVILFEGTLLLGEDASVCSVSDTIIYEEFDEAIGVFGPPISARCDGDEIEF